MEEPSAAERRVQAGAAMFGVCVAIVAAVTIGATSGVSIGLAAFFLSWTFIAAFVLLVRFIYRRMVQPEMPAPPQAAQPGSAGHQRRRRKRRR